MRYRRLGTVAALAATMTATPAAACLVPAIFYFAPGSAELSERSEQDLTFMVGWLQRRGDGLSSLEISGHSDRTGTARSRAAISLARAQAVRDWLIRRGIPATRIVLRASRDSIPSVETPDGVPEPDNRRVEIAITLTEAGEEALRQRPPTQPGGLATCD